jgi:hypothetical protein
MCEDGVPQSARLICQPVLSINMWEMRPVCWTRYGIQECSGGWGIVVRLGNNAKGRMGKEDFVG